VLGAIAMKRTIATSRSDDNPTNPIKNQPINDRRRNVTLFQKGDNAKYYRSAQNPMQTALA
jgi:hypothetical protein